MSRYTLSVDSEKTEHSVTGTSPAKALRELVQMAGMELASQDGRYGRTTDGHSVAALTAPWTRVRYEDHGTTRL